jgi:hypothetical protein
MIWSRIDFEHESIKRETNQAIAELAGNIDKAFRELMGVENDRNRFRQIQTVLVKATMLSRTFMRQRAYYTFDFPTTSITDIKVFQSDTMCDLHGAEKPDWNGRSVHIAVSPVVTKFGDEEGEDVCEKVASVKNNVNHE